MKIPSRVQLMGRVIETVYQDNLKDSEECVGKYDDTGEKIIVQTANTSNSITNDFQAITYFHELTHHILRMFDFVDDVKDIEEKLCSTIAEVFYQVGHQINWHDCRCTDTDNKE